MEFKWIAKRLDINLECYNCNKIKNLAFNDRSSRL